MGEPIHNCLNLLRVHLYLARLDNEPQELDLGHMKLTFLMFDIKMVVKKASENLIDMFHILLEGTREDG